MSECPMETVYDALKQMQWLLDRTRKRPSQIHSNQRKAETLFDSASPDMDSSQRAEAKKILKGFEEIREIQRERAYESDEPYVPFEPEESERREEREAQEKTAKEGKEWMESPYGGGF